MIVGTQITHDGTGTTRYYSPAFPRGGEAALFSLDATHKYGASVAMDVAVEHKNSDETSWGVADTFSTISAVGVPTKDISGLKEQIRFSFTFSAGSAGNFFHVVAPPAWRPCRTDH